MEVSSGAPVGRVRSSEWDVGVRSQKNVLIGPCRLQRNPIWMRYISQGPRPSKRKAEPQVKWSEAVLRARNSLRTRGFCPVGGARCRQFSHPVSLMIRHLDHLTPFHQAEMIVKPVTSQEIDGCRNGRVWICQR